ncbi:MAG TPA: zinc-binding dehydrogenase [Gaiellales bacterium]|jgi:Zn-dependent alcohol dehydrogenase
MPRAAVCRRFAQPLTVEPVTLDPPGPDEVRIRVTACAICHSDVAYAGGDWGGALPAVFGHEACGVVVEAGPGVVTPAAGDRVVVGLVRSCGRCARCREGAPALCEARFRLDNASPIVLAGGERAVQGMRCGAFADEVVVHASQAVTIPDGVPETSACLIACAVMTGIGAAARDARVRPGENVVVIGVGGVGLNAIQGAALAGARRVIAVDLSEAKLAAAARLGATATVDASASDPAERVRAETAGAGADIVIVTTGAASAVGQGLDCLRRGGTLVCVGMPAHGRPAQFDAGALAHDGKRILGSKLGSARPAVDIPRIAGLYLDGRLKLDELVTAVYPLERINEAIASMRSGEAIRNVIVP